MIEQLSTPVGLTQVHQQTALAKRTIEHTTAVKEGVRRAAMREATRVSYSAGLSYIRSWGKAALGGLDLFPYLPETIDAGDINATPPPMEDLEQAPIPPAIIEAFIAQSLDPLPDVEDILTARFSPWSPSDSPKGPEWKRPRVKALKKPGRHTLATINRRLSALSWLYRISKVPATQNPCKDLGVRELLRTSSKAWRDNGGKVAKKSAATKDVLEKMLSSCDGDLLGLRDRAVLLVSAAGGLRRSELVSMDVEHLSPIPGSVCGGLMYQIQRTKTSSDGRKVALFGKVAEALEAWIAACGVKAGAVFTRLDNAARGAAIRMTGDSVAKAVKRRARLAGFDDVADYSGHSMRRGFATQCARDGVSISDWMDLGGWKDFKTASGYVQALKVEKNPAARVFS